MTRVPLITLDAARRQVSVRRGLVTRAQNACDACTCGVWRCRHTEALERAEVAFDAARLALQAVESQQPDRGMRAWTPEGMVR